MADSMSELGRAALDYVSMGLAVVPLRPRSKEPATAHGLRDWTDDPDSVREVWGAHPDLNVGIVCGAPSGGLVAIDLDCHEDGPDGMASLREWELAHGDLPETCTAVTGSGGLHMLYRADGEVRPSANAGLGVDVRGDGSYIVAPPSVHPNGRRYEWEVPPDELAPRPADGAVTAFLDHVRPAGASGEGRRLEVPDVIGEGGRNDALYRMGCSMRAKGLPPDVIADALAGVNAARCRPPLPADEVAAVARSVAERPAGRSAEWEESHGARGGQGQLPAVTAVTLDEAEAEILASYGAVNGNNKIVPAGFASMMVERDHVCHVGWRDGPLAVWAGDRYEIGDQAINRAIVRHCRSTRGADRKEVRDYLSIVAPVVPEANCRYVAFANGVLDVEDGSGRLMPSTPDLLIANVIPHDYDQGAECPVVDATLDKMACGDVSRLTNLYEVLGVCMYRSNDFAASPILTGGGSNGKSTFLRMLKALLGRQNYSTLDINMLSANGFQVGNLAGKLANIGDDISNEFLRGNALSLFKNVTSGEDVYTDVKGGQGYSFVPHSTMVFSSNEFPRLGDATDGMIRRLFPIRFAAKFSRDDPDYDPHITEKVTSEEACKRLAVLGVIGLSSVILGKGFTPNEESDKIRSDIKAENDSVLQWMGEESRTAESIRGQRTSDVYGDYVEWCGESRMQPMQRNRFTRRACELTGLSSALAYGTVGGTARRFVDA